jgi:HSP20 family protein
MSRAVSGTWRPPKELVALRDRLAEVFDADGGVEGEHSDATEAALRWIPALDVAANEELVIVSLEASGVPPDALSVAVESEQLVVRGQRQREIPDRFHRLERPMGPFERAVRLPVPVDPSGAEARLERGVLVVRLPRVSTPVAGGRDVPVVPL